MTVVPSPPEFAVARVFDLPQPYTPSPIALDRKTLADRMFRGRGQPRDWPEMDRDLAAETFSVRLPAGHNPRRPAGLLVWQSPSPDGTIPRPFHAAADALNFICIGAHNAGNFRGVDPSQTTGADAADRFQLVLDAIATARTTWWIDPDRVYLTGLSGGGRITSMMWHCFPDVIKGGVAIVGLNSPHTVRIRDDFYSPPGYVRPAPNLRELTETQRLAAITGTEDFNGPETVVRVDHHLKDGKAIRLWNIPGMAHEFPTPETFLEAMTWVDDPARDARDANLDAAREALHAYIDAFGPDAPTDAGARSELLAIIDLAPWTEPAFVAAEILGYLKTPE